MDQQNTQLPTPFPRLDAVSKRAIIAGSGAVHVLRPMGLEIEYGITGPNNLDPTITANHVRLSTYVVMAYLDKYLPVNAVSWDYLSEDPLNDARGFRLNRAAAHPSMLTDRPDLLAPSGDSTQQAPLQYVGPQANALLRSGGRFYVDHAHPEYCTGEAMTPREVVLADRAGEIIALEASELLAKYGAAGKWGTEPLNVVLYKNNTDGKGASYGAHENYTMSRQVDFADVIKYLTPFLVTRQIFCGAGRVGIGQHSEKVGFQISQRADFVENHVGLETTFDRPIINTRDESHASSHLRRLHVIVGDANSFDISLLLKVGTTALVIAIIENGAPLEMDALEILDPVAEYWNVSRDLSLTHQIGMFDGSTKTALEIQRFYLQLVSQAAKEQGWEHEPHTAEILYRWQEVIDLLEYDLPAAATKVEWVGKYQLLEAMRQRLNTTWEDPKMAQMDLQWHDLRPEKSLVQALAKAGRVERLFSDVEVAAAAQHSPRTTRAFLRSELLNYAHKHLVGANWRSLTWDFGVEGGGLWRLDLNDPAYSLPDNHLNDLADLATEFEKVENTKQIEDLITQVSNGEEKEIISSARHVISNNAEGIENATEW